MEKERSYGGATTPLIHWVHAKTSVLFEKKKIGNAKHDTQEKFKHVKGELELIVEYLDEFFHEHKLGYLETILTGHAGMHAFGWGI